MGNVKVVIAVVKHPLVKSGIRRMIYAALRSGGVKTDIGWIIRSDRTLRRLLTLNERARLREGVEAVRLYEITMTRREYNAIMSAAKKGKGKKGVEV
ncbi:MAG: hypothetical protein QXO22_04325 [Thermosphaera sp.]